MTVLPSDVHDHFCAACLTHRVQFVTDYECPLCAEPKPPRPFPSLPTPLCAWPVETWVSP